MTTAVVHVSQVRSERTTAYGGQQSNRFHYSDTPRFICREPVRVSTGIVCSSCDALIDTAGMCSCSS